MTIEYSKRARGVLGLLGMMSAIQFNMRVGKPSPEMQAALDELVEKGAAQKITGTGDLPPGAVRYQSTLSREERTMHWAWLRHNQDDPELSFDQTVPI